MAQKTYISPMMLVGRLPRRLADDWSEPETPAATNPATGTFNYYANRRWRRKRRGNR